MVVASPLGNGIGKLSVSAVAFDPFPAGSHPIDPTAAVPETAIPSSTGQHTSGLQPHDTGLSSFSSAMGIEQPLPPAPQPFAGVQSADSAPLSRTPSLTLGTGSRAPSLTAAQNLSTNSLSSLASGSTAAITARSPSPASEYQASRGSMGEADDEAQKLRRQLRHMKSRHEEELRKLNADHDARLAAIQAQAVAKMKELIEKVCQH